MPTKDELYTILDEDGKHSYSTPEVKGIVTSVRARAKVSPNSVKMGDVFVGGTGGKYRPCVVVKVIKDTSYAIPLSTTKDKMNILPSKSRFLGDGVFGAGILKATNEHIAENFICVYENKRQLREAVKISVSEIMKII